MTCFIFKATFDQNHMDQCDRILSIFNHMHQKNLFVYSSCAPRCQMQSIHLCILDYSTSHSLLSPHDVFQELRCTREHVLRTPAGGRSMEETRKHKKDENTPEQRREVKPTTE